MPPRQGKRPHHPRWTQALSQRSQLIPAPVRAPGAPRGDGGRGGYVQFCLVLVRLRRRLSRCSRICSSVSCASLLLELRRLGGGKQRSLVCAPPPKPGCGTPCLWGDRVSQPQTLQRRERCPGVPQKLEWGDRGAAKIRFLAGQHMLLQGTNPARGDAAAVSGSSGCPMLSPGRGMVPGAEHPGPQLAAR